MTVFPPYRFVTRRQWRIVVAVSALAVFTAGARAGSARVHATLVSSAPAAGSRLVSMPSAVRLVFSEPVEAPLSRLVLVDSAGGSLTLAARADPRDVHVVLASVAALAPGGYRLNWRVVSADGHAVTGTFVFSVGAPASATDQPPSVPPPPADSIGAAWGLAVAGAPLGPALLRSAALGTLMALGGILLFLVLAEREQSVPRRANRAARGLAVAAPVLLGAHFTAWLVSVAPSHTLDQRVLADALTTLPGRVELWRIALALLVAWALWLARRPGLALVFAAGALAVSGLTGHPLAIRTVLTAPAKASHLLAGAAWLGGLLWLMIRAFDDAGSFARDARRVSAIAALSVCVVAASGIAQTLLILPSPMDLVRSAYGWLALAKAAGLFVLVAFGAYHRKRLLPPLDPSASSSTLQTSVRREIIVMCVVILLGALLAYVPPPAL